MGQTEVDADLGGHDHVEDGGGRGTQQRQRPHQHDDEHHAPLGAHDVGLDGEHDGNVAEKQNKNKNQLKYNKK